MLLLPFSRFSMQGAIGLNALDYHLPVIKLVDGSQKTWRDMGVQFRGYAFDQTLQYRVGVFAGTRGVGLQKDAKGELVKDKDGKLALMSNPKDYPRLAGHVRWNILGKESDAFAKGIYFASDPILSIGAGFDMMFDSVMNTPTELDAAKAVTKAGTQTYSIGATGDVYLDYPFGAEKEHEVIAQAGFFFYRQGNEVIYDKQGVSSLVASRNSGIGVAGEAGYRWKFVEPVFSVDWWKSDQANQDVLAMRGGVNFWIQKHQANIKTEFGAQRTGDSSAPFKMSVTSQAQLFF
jgi:hypothetical protein